MRVRGFQNTKAALDHLEAIPEKQGLMENFRDLEVCSLSVLVFGPLGLAHDRCADAASVFCLQESQRERAKVEERYIKHKEIVWDLQYQLDESRRKAQEYRVRHTLIHQHSRLKKKNRRSFVMPYHSLRSSATTHTFSICVPNCSACSNTSGLDKDSLTMRAIYGSGSPTPVPTCAPHLILRLV